jgi:hypothetical protein
MAKDVTKDHDPARNAKAASRASDSKRKKLADALRQNLSKRKSAQPPDPQGERKGG